MDPIDFGLLETGGCPGGQGTSEKLQLSQVAEYVQDYMDFFDTAAPGSGFEVVLALSDGDLAKQMELLEEVGRGSEGPVYKARHVADKGTIVAAKKICCGNPSTDNSTLVIQDFGTCCVSLQHLVQNPMLQRTRNLVKNLKAVVYFVPHELSVYLLMDYVEHQNLKKMVFLNAKQIVEQFAVHAGQAVITLHKVGVAACDLKPEQFMVPKAGSDWLPMGDIGGWRTVGEKQSANEMYSPAYMPPEFYDEKMCNKVTAHGVETTCKVPVPSMEADAFAFGIILIDLARGPGKNLLMDTWRTRDERELMGRVNRTPQDILQVYHDVQCRLRKVYQWASPTPQELEQLKGKQLEPIFAVAEQLTAFDVKQRMSILGMFATGLVPRELVLRQLLLAQREGREEDVETWNQLLTIIPETPVDPKYDAGFTQEEKAAWLAPFMPAQPAQEQLDAIVASSNTVADVSTPAELEPTVDAQSEFSPITSEEDLPQECGKDVLQETLNETTAKSADGSSSLPAAGSPTGPLTPQLSGTFSPLAKHSCIDLNSFTKIAEPCSALQDVLSSSEADDISSRTLLAAAEPQTCGLAQEVPTSACAVAALAEGDDSLPAAGSPTAGARRQLFTDAHEQISEQIVETTAELPAVATAQPAGAVELTPEAAMPVEANKPPNWSLWKAARVVGAVAAGSAAGAIAGCVGGAVYGAASSAYASYKQGHSLTAMGRATVQSSVCTSLRGVWLGGWTGAHLVAGYYKDS